MTKDAKISKLETELKRARKEIRKQEEVIKHKYSQIALFMGSGILLIIRLLQR